MRERVLSLSVLMACLAWPGSGWAQSPATTAAAEKIGVINIQASIFNTAEGKQALADLQKKYQPRQDDLQKQQTEIQSLQDQLQRQQTTLSDMERVRLTRELADKQKLFQRARDDAQSDYQDDRQDVINRIGQKMMQIISDYAKQNSYELILDAQIPVYNGSQTFDAQIPIYFAAKDVDISDEIVKRYDAAFPATSGSAPAAPKPTGHAAATPKAPAQPPVKK